MNDSTLSERGGSKTIVEFPPFIWKLANHQIDMWVLMNHNLPSFSPCYCGKDRPPFLVEHLEYLRTAE